MLEWTGQDDEVVERVLTLTEEQLRRPLRRGWVLIKHVDGQPGWATKGTRRGGKPAGYFDPP